MKAILEKIDPENLSASVSALVELIDAIRPPKPSQAEYARQKITGLTYLLKCETTLLDKLTQSLKLLLETRNPFPLYTETGILTNRGFFYELFEKLEYRFLPPARGKDDLRILLERLFPKDSDCQWIRAVPDETWGELIALFSKPKRDKALYRSKNLSNLISAIQILSHNIAALGLDPEITIKMPELDRLSSPFLLQNTEITFYLENYLLNKYDTLNNDDFRHIEFTLEQCEYSVSFLRKSRDRYGTSLSLTNRILRLHQLVMRLKRLFVLLHYNDREEYNQTLVSFFKHLIKSEQQRYHVIKHIRKNVDLLTRQIVEHTARTGEKYIASTPREYTRFFWSSLFCGVLVAFFAAFKILIYGLDWSPFFKSLAFSMNYAIAFMMMYVLGAKLSSKQPAVTAARIAMSINKDMKELNTAKPLINTVLRAHRSQFITFWGNLLMAFPVGYSLAWLYGQVFYTPLVSPDKAEKIIQEIHPFESLSLVYAAITGLLLFASGLISGYYDNKVVFAQIPYRMKHHRRLRRCMPARTLIRFSNYIEKHMGSLSGNFFFGILFGVMLVIGYLFSISLDIRHTAFSASDFAIAWQSLDHALSAETILWTILGILMIGMFNFTISFGLALHLAIKARTEDITRTRHLIRLLLSYFLRHPFSLFRRIPASTKTSDAPQKEASQGA